MKCRNNNILEGVKIIFFFSLEGSKTPPESAFLTPLNQRIPSFLLRSYLDPPF